MKPTETRVKAPAITFPWLESFGRTEPDVPVLPGEREETKNDVFAMSVLICDREVMYSATPGTLL